MLLDLIDTNNYASYNIRLAQILGLEAAVYCNQLLTIQNKALRKNRLAEGFVCLDRDYIQRQTTLSLDRQIALDLQLEQIGVMQRQPEDSNKILLQVEALGGLITDEADLDLQAKLSEAIESKWQKKKARLEAKEAKQQAIKTQLLQGLGCRNVELQAALGNWIDAINQNPKVPPVNKATLRTFYDTVNGYTHGADLDQALKIIQIATAYSWRDARWAIDRYEQAQQAQAVQYKPGAGQIGGRY